MGVTEPGLTGFQKSMLYKFVTEEAANIANSDCSNKRKKKLYAALHNAIREQKELFIKQNMEKKDGKEESK